MPRIGEYRDKIAILSRVLAAPDEDGEPVESWPDPRPAQEHWARIEAPSGDESNQTPRGSDNSAVLRFRHLVKLAAVDRVRIKETGDVYAVVGIWRERAESGGWQTVCALAAPLIP
ncbi:Phage head-tail joining protein [Gemmata sp. SH-PL17]|uniref:phage head completion protein n=1 Tax=Gemmata sp. SH-PL17 TaxID=1630693 RepID=UPI00078EB64C|nr:head-tail adaptor protein [Gemmata sp. SH-PL17]AMV23420.1 Phage head-tail joining protein [Gemmata sp. SH-PL17]